MIIQGQVGPLSTTASLSSGTNPTARLGNMGDSIVSELHGRYYEATYRRTIFYAAGLAQTTTAFVNGTTTTLVGLTISNPTSSTVNLVLNKVGIAYTVGFPAAAMVGIATGFSATVNVTQTTPVAIRPGYVSSNTAGFGLVSTSVVTPVAPNITHVLGAALTGAITTTPYVVPQMFDLEGSLILSPGGFASIVTTATSGTSGAFYSFSWEEVPV